MIIYVKTLHKLKNPKKSIVVKLLPGSVGQMEGKDLRWTLCFEPT